MVQWINKSQTFRDVRIARPTGKHCFSRPQRTSFRYTTLVHWYFYVHASPPCYPRATVLTSRKLPAVFQCIQNFRIKKKTSKFYELTLKPFSLSEASTILRFERNAQSVLDSNFIDWRDNQPSNAHRLATCSIRNKKKRTKKSRKKIKKRDTRSSWVGARARRTRTLVDTYTHTETLFVYWQWRKEGDEDGSGSSPGGEKKKETPPRHFLSPRTGIIINLFAHVKVTVTV